MIYILIRFSVNRYFQLFVSIFLPPPKVTFKSDSTRVADSVSRRVVIGELFVIFANDECRFNNQQTSATNDVQASSQETVVGVAIYANDRDLNFNFRQGNAFVDLARLSEWTSSGLPERSLNYCQYHWHRSAFDSRTISEPCSIDESCNGEFKFHRETVGVILRTPLANRCHLNINPAGGRSPRQPRVSFKFQFRPVDSPFFPSHPFPSIFAPLALAIDGSFANPAIDFIISIPSARLKLPVFLYTLRFNCNCNRGDNYYRSRGSLVLHLPRAFCK